MEAKIIGVDRERVIHILTQVTGIPPDYRPLPTFSCSIGGYLLHRDGRIIAEDVTGLQILASLGLCDYPTEAEEKPAGIAYSIEGYTGQTLFHIVSIISARQNLINPAINAKKAFCISSALMRDLCDHPPATISDFLYSIYGREDECTGLRFTQHFIHFTGFEKAAAGEQGLCRQLAESIVETARSVQWTKPFTKNVRNKKYAMRTWLNAMGMSGGEYEQLRHTFLSRLPGTSDKHMKRGKN